MNNEKKEIQNFKQCGSGIYTKQQQIRFIMAQPKMDLKGDSLPICPFPQLYVRRSRNSQG